MTGFLWLWRKLLICLMRGNVLSIFHAASTASHISVALLV
jgi:hypothetical protein